MNRSNTTRAGGYGGGGYDDEEFFSNRNRPTRPTAPKPVFGQKTGSGAGLREDQAVALFTFDADQEGDLGFKKGEVITIIKRTEKAEDWWTGRIGDRTGIFPRYVSLPSLFV